MKITYPALFFVCLITVLATACSKDKLPDAGGNTLDKIEFFNASQQSTGSLQFNYDGQNRLTEINNSTGGKEIFAYNGQGRLTQYTETGSPTNIILTYAYIYDVNGKIVSRKGTPILPNLLVDDYSYTYDALGRVITDSVYTLGVLMSYSNYQYDNNNNVVGVQQFTKLGASFQTEGLLIVTYDNKISPFSQNGNILFYTQGGFSYLSKDNIISEVIGQTVTPANQYIPAYYSNGLLRSRSVSGTNPNTTIYTYKQP